MGSNFRIIVSYYEGRPSSHLFDLLISLDHFISDVTVVVNSDSSEISIPASSKFRLIQNRNVGMNIGAWHVGFLDDPSADYYLFLQDECYLKRRDFKDLLVTRFKSSPELGLLGESINRRWGCDWSVLQRSPINSLEPDHSIDGVPSRRVETYLSAMRKWGINPGVTGEHLRSLVWAFPGYVLRELGGFPIGTSRGECIAAEIAVSRRIIDMGLKFDQFAVRPFTFFGHSEWRMDGVSKIY